MTADALTIPELAGATDVALLLLRWTLAAPFLASGWAHVTRPVERGESIGLGPGATRTLAVVEVVAGAMLVLGLWGSPPPRSSSSWPAPSRRRSSCGRRASSGTRGTAGTTSCSSSSAASCC